MKPINLIFFALVIAQALCGSASAQSFAAKITLDYNVEHVIVKSYNYPTTITSCNFSDPNTFRSMFIYSDTNHIHRLPAIQILLDGYKINDFSIDHDSVFFCGQSQDGKGIIGFFDIDDLFFNSGFFYIQTQFDIYDGFYYRPAETFTKLITYYICGQRRHIVCIGYSQEFDPGCKYGCVVDLYRDDRRAQSLTPWYYESGVKYKSDTNCFRAITRAGDYVVTAGFENDYYISFRLFEAAQIFSITGPQNFSLIFNNSSSPKYFKWKNQDLLLTAKSTGTVTTAALWDIPGIYKEHSIHIATYSIAQLLAALPTSMTNSVVIHYRNKPTKLFDFIANWSNQKYALIHLATNTIPQAFSIFTEFDYNLQSITGAMNANYNNSDIFHRGLQSIDTYNNYSQYVMGGIYSKQNNILTYNVETSEQPSLCQPNLECSIDTCTKIQATINPHGLSTIGGYKTISNIPRYDSIMKTIMIECEMLNE